MKSSAQVTITPMIIDALLSAIEIMKSQLNNSSLIEAAEGDDISGEVCRAALVNGDCQRAILKVFVRRAQEQLQ